MTDANEIARAMTPPSRGQCVLMPLLSLALFLAASYTVLIGYDWVPSSQSILSRRSRAW